MLRPYRCARERSTPPRPRAFAHKSATSFDWRSPREKGHSQLLESSELSTLQRFLETAAFLPIRGSVPLPPRVCLRLGEEQALFLKKSEGEPRVKRSTDKNRENIIPGLPGKPLPPSPLQPRHPPPLLRPDQYLHT